MAENIWTKPLGDEAERRRQAEEQSIGAEFAFEVVTVNAKGKIVTRAPRTARQKIFELGQGVKLAMVYIPGGTFLMGSPDNEEGRWSDEGPQHTVTIQPFYMGKYPVTQAQWQAIMGNNPSKFKGPNRPVEQISWHDAQEFCQRLNATHPYPSQEGKTGTPLLGGDGGGFLFRLPSEAEWEYVCRAGTATPFYFGDTITTDLANYEGEYTYGDGPKGEYREQTTDVGQFNPNVFGLYDMHGNVWEWCADSWHENYQGAPTDGSVWGTLDDGKAKLLRGGSWNDYPIRVRSASRLRNAADSRYDFIGLRVVCVR